VSFVVAKMVDRVSRPKIEDDDIGWNVPCEQQEPDLIFRSGSEYLSRNNFPT
jgi:hypothetical protein